MHRELVFRLADPKLVDPTTYKHTLPRLLARQARPSRETLARWGYRLSVLGDSVQEGETSEQEEGREGEGYALVFEGGEGGSVMLRLPRELNVGECACASPMVASLSGMSAPKEVAAFLFGVMVGMCDAWPGGFVIEYRDGVDEGWGVYDGSGDGEEESMSSDGEEYDEYEYDEEDVGSYEMGNGFAASSGTLYGHYRHSMVR
ncbi:hypothetical protein BC938DRAFT_480167 [Jimgerdemannia flammicorona]|uniref:Uncharacterized protein n=1 Tax=Jimgerdemannia flammicorona TaxID=994334 RepID=A0A433QJ93_9FUNG|nr:hypothetical protein BC938DRAFT_480167 [Jimgerdemannia flammicorona]